MNKRQRKKVRTREAFEQMGVSARTARRLTNWYRASKRDGLRSVHVIRRHPGEEPSGTDGTPVVDRGMDEIFQEFLAMVKAVRRGRCQPYAEFR